MSALVASIAFIVLGFLAFSLLRKSARVSDLESLEKEITLDFIEEFNSEDEVSEALLDWLEEADSDAITRT